MLGRDRKTSSGSSTKGRPMEKAILLVWYLCVLIFHAGMKHALEADGPGMLSMRAQALFRSHSQLRRTESDFFFLTFADSKGSKA